MENFERYELQWIVIPASSLGTGPGDPILFGTQEEEYVL
jgi:hypothetical protein